MPQRPSLTLSSSLDYLSKTATRVDPLHDLASMNISVEPDYTNGVREFSDEVSAHWVCLLAPRLYAIGGWSCRYNIDFGDFHGEHDRSDLLNAHIAAIMKQEKEVLGPGFRKLEVEEGR